MLLGATPAAAVTTTNLVVNPLTPVYDTNNVAGVPADAATGFASGSLASNGVAKTDMYFTPAMLFGGPVTLGQVKNMSYWTKTGATHTVDPRDWFLAIYTNPYPGDVSTPTWYGDRIGAEPYFSAALADPANTWNQWTTDGPSNKLRFFESTQGAPGATFGSYTDPDWTTRMAGNALSGLPYAGHSILFFSVQTGSAWAAGFTGQLDGFRIELFDGSVATVNFEPVECVTNIDCETDGLFCTYATCTLGICSSAPRDCVSTDVSAINFESPTYTAGTINGQDGWSSTGAAGSGCAVYDHAVASSAGTAGFGAQSLRISNSVTSGCFSDQTFSKSLANEVGETTATNGGMSGGVRRTHFESQFAIASKVPGAEQPGLVMSTSADRGDGARMTYLRFEDSPTGIQVYFDDYQDAAPYGSVGNEVPGCDVEDDFIETQVGTDLNRAVPHTIRETLDVFEGPRNDVVKVYIDGILVHTGTSWEDYFRWCEATDVSRTVDSRLFRTGGTAVPANAGKGFLIDNLSLQSGTGGTECNNICNEAADSCQTPVNTACTADANGCTDDVCDGSGSCTHPNNTAPCGDGLFCNGTDTCSGGACGHSGNPCTGGVECNNVCNEAADNCAAASGTACTADANVCTDDKCNGSGACTHPNNTAPCDDGLFCNGTDTCGGGTCGHAGDPCAGGLECNNTCNEAADNCAVAGGTACTTDSNICTNDVCNGSGACTHPLTAVCLELDPTLVTVRQQKPGKSNGSINVKGDFITGPPADTFDNTNPITLSISDGLVLSSTHTWSTTDCLLLGSGVIKCTSPDKHFKGLFLPVKAQPGVFRMRARFKNLAINGPFSAPVSVTLMHGSGPTSRAGQVSDCQTTNAGIKCRQY